MSLTAAKKTTLYYDYVCMNALTAVTLCAVAGLDVELSPTSLQKGEQLGQDYMKKFPLHHIPGLEVELEDGSTVCFDESATILRYLCNANPEKTSEYYPIDNPLQRALIDRAMDWRNTEYMPCLTSATYGMLWGVPYPLFTNPEVVAGAVQGVSQQLEYLATHLLSDDHKFLAGRDTPSIAEFHIIPSLATIRPFEGTEREMKIPPRVEQWIQDFYEVCPQVLEIQKKVQIPHMANMKSVFADKIPAKKENEAP